MRAAGVDGAGRQGAWVMVVVEDGHLHSASTHPDLPSVMAAAAECDAIGIDIPIGHEQRDATGRRACDVEARARLGPERGRSVFWVPPPAVLRAADLTQGIAVSVRSGWMKPSPLLWGLRQRILEAHEASKDPRVHEVHPELSFQALALQLKKPTPLRHPKSTWDGLVERLELLHAAKLRPTRSFGGLGRASPDDVLDATIAAWTASRIALGEAVPLPAERLLDPETGRRVAIWA